MKDLLIGKPVIGAASGIGSGIIYVIKSAITDDNVLKYAAGIAVWVGLIVAAMSFYLKLIEIRNTKRAKK